MLRKRCVIYPKDIQIITGRSERYCHALIKKIKIFYGKDDHQFITQEEFSDFSGIPIEQVAQYII
ncbi:hypothetical protein J0A67_17345 [Algoriphagus aestuariicola]|jgi:tRNA U34 5-carboxymethylaminomethyl modifying enzyme MnmG/GidA|uniref:Uncharacterized protein n=1 Tax=Algoriphagus aestuariicola TaxID=1852016 RepID=A0ABS3BTK2_9BACT|nr:hypothetical protein [Algoriphagus aestuariicola]MBN7802645.1 hypothetical protein [Algoriphagus aestuariicola]